jgi:hypothetical protein
MADDKAKHVDQKGEEQVNSPVDGQKDTPLTDKEAQSVVGGVMVEGVKKTMSTQV